MPLTSTFRLAAVIGSILVTASVIAAPADAEAPDRRSMQRPLAAEVDAAVPDIEWHDCGGQAAGLDCARVRVPLDYDKPDDTKITLDLLRDPADRPRERIGTLFVNPGGPGASATGFAQQVGAAFGKQVTRRFDVVGIDPRGVGFTTNAKCEGRSRQHPTYPDVEFPFGSAQEKRWIKADTSIRRVCATHHNAVFDHVTTADTARDMDLIRQALGERRLSYYGISYGSYLGQTYAAMFPDRVRAMVIDGVLDPVAWSTGRGDVGKQHGFSTRIRSGHGSYEALVSGLTECDRVGKKRCPAAGDAYGKWRTIIRKARNGRLVVGDKKVGYSRLISNALGALYTRGGYRTLMNYIQSLYRKTTHKPNTRAARRASMTAARSGDRLNHIWQDRARRGLYAAPAAPKKRRINDAFSSIACADSVNPQDPTKWIGASRRDDYTMPWFGRLWTWESSLCSRWPGSGADAYRGAWKTKTSTPILIIGNAHDPATPIRGAHAANRAFEGSRLLTLNGWGHGALAESTCITRRTQAYLVRRQLPPPSTVCQPDKALYPPQSR